MLKTIFTTCCLGLAIVACPAAQAQTPVIAQYDFNNPLPQPNFGLRPNVNPNNGPTAFQATVSDENVNAGSFVGGAGFDNINVTGRDSLIVSEALALSPGIGNDLANAIDEDEYIGVTLTTELGSVLDLDNVTFVTARANIGAQDYAFFSSVGGFDLGDEIVFANNAIPPGAIGTAGVRQTIDLSSPDFDGLDSIEFRIVFDDRVAAGEFQSVTAIDTFTVNGSVVAAVPEPSAIVVLGLGGLGMLVRRRK